MTITLLAAVNIVIQEAGESKVASIDVPTGAKAARALTDTYNEILTSADWRFTTQTVQATSWNKEIATFEAGFQRALRVLRTDNIGRKRKLIQVDEQKFFEGTIVPGEYARYWAVLSENTIGVTPYPETDSGKDNISFVVISNPVIPTIGTQTFDPLPTSFEPALIKGAVARFIRSHIQDEPRSAVYQREYQNMIYMRQQRERRTKSTRTATMFDHLYRRG